MVHSLRYYMQHFCILKASLSVAAFGYCSNAYAYTVYSAQYGLNGYYGKSVDEMNKRLGHSPLLSTKYQFGRANGFVADMMFDFRHKDLLIDLSLSRFSEAISGTGETTDAPSVSSSLAAYHIFGGLGTRVWPRNAPRGREQPGGSSPSSSNRKGSKMNFNLFAFVGSGVFWAQHSYSFKYPGDETYVKYNTKTLHLAHGGVLRFITTLVPNLEMVSEVGIFQTQKKSSEGQLEKFTVRQEDLRYVPAKAGMNSVTDSPFRIIRFAIGFAFTPNITTKKPSQK